MAVFSQEVVLQGTSICRGIAIGHPYFFTLPEEMVPEYGISVDAVHEEIARYQLALDRGREDIKSLQDRLRRECIFDGVAILEAHLLIMQDPMLTTHVEEQVRTTKKNVDYVFQMIMKKYQKKFDAIKDSFFRERFKDIQDISRRILGHLRHGAHRCLKNVPANSIVFATDLTACDTAEAQNDCVVAFVTCSGGATSHAAIVAKAKGIPYVSSINFEQIAIEKDGWVVVDGRTGAIIVNPSEETLLKYQELRNQLHMHLEKLTQTGKLEAETYDGYGVQLSANIEMCSELDMLHQFGGSGVGLLRTESAFLTKEQLPTEEEQFAIYRDFVEQMKGLSIVIRTFDLGGDKYLRNQQTIESNPFLGCRAIRFSLREKEVFKAQLRAILRASAFGSVSIMFPMVSSLSELREAKAILREVRKELEAKQEPIASYIPVGCMIEVPSAAIVADLLAKECDFLSIGTNDLVQYTLAVDRSNSNLSELYSPTNPSILRLIRLIVSEANHHGIPVTVCGEVAADPRFTPLLLGLGVHELSVASRYLPIVKHAIRNTSIVAASKLAEEALLLDSAADIEELLNREYQRNAPEDRLYNLFNMNL